MKYSENEERLMKAVRTAELLIARHQVPFSEAMAALEACDQLPEADTIRHVVQRLRLLATRLYECPESEVERELLEFHRVEPDVYYRASATIGACAERPNLASKHLPRIIKELDAAIAVSPHKGKGKARTKALKNVRNGVLSLCERLGIGARQPKP